MYAFEPRQVVHCGAVTFDGIIKAVRAGARGGGFFSARFPSRMGTVSVLVAIQSLIVEDREPMVLSETRHDLGNEPPLTSRSKVAVLKPRSRATWGRRRI
jgi:hypothetical protein